MPTAIHYTPAPAKGVLALRRITVREVARHIGMHEQVVGRMLNGREPATRRFREALSQLLRLPEAQLFLDEPLANGPRGLPR